MSLRWPLVSVLLPLLCILQVSSSFVIAPNIRTSNQSVLKMSSPLDAGTCSVTTSQTFAGNTILLTGASGGLGRAFALQLAHSKAHTLILSGRNQEALKSVEDECKSIFPDIITHIICCDLSDKKSVAELSKKALDVCNQRIDVLINNGGVSSRSRFIDTALEVDEKVMQINFFAGAGLAKAVVPGMIERSYGKIIWISSVQGRFGIPNRTSYASSKFAVQGYCEALRSEVATSGITVHVASPGYICTNLGKSAITGDGSPYAKVDASALAGADPNDVAIDILDKSAAGKADFLTAADFNAKAAIFLKFFAPSFLNQKLVKRYEKSQRPDA